MTKFTTNKNKQKKKKHMHLDVTALFTTAKK